MATYVIGDLQGCYDPFMALLKKIDFKIDSDRLWLTGDLINRGPKSLETLRTVVSLADNVITVLGNHDLSLLAYAQGISRGRNYDFESITKAKDAKTLLSWLTKQPLMHKDEVHQAVMVHAGIPPCWTIDEAYQHACVADQRLKDPNFYKHMYGDKPSRWEDATSFDEQCRFTINALTRLRFMTNDGHLDLQDKGEISPQNSALAWFNSPMRQSDTYKIFFGHWAALKGACPVPHIYGLDTGCVWGGPLTAFCLETSLITQVP